MKRLCLDLPDAVPGGLHWHTQRRTSLCPASRAERYLGRWYEIARLDHSFERGMSRVTAEYRKRDDGGIEVINRGYLADSKAWKEARGKAYFVDGSDKGYLKVSFFGPFYGSYVVFELDAKDYRYAWSAAPTVPTCGCWRAARRWTPPHATGLSPAPRRWASTPPS